MTDAGATITVECTPGDYVDGPPSDPANGLYAFSHDFTVGPHVISCTATDGYQQSPPASFSIEVFDDTDVPVIFIRQ